MRHKRRNILVSITLVEASVGAVEIDLVEKILGPDGYYTDEGWAEQIVIALRERVPNRYTTEVEVLMLTDQGEV